MRLCSFLLVLTVLPSIAVPQSADRNSQAIETGQRSPVSTGDGSQMVAGRDVTVNNYQQQDFRRDLERQIARLEIELERETAKSGLAQEDLLQKRRELDGARSRLADIEASYQEKLAELERLQAELASLGPEADRARVQAAQVALHDGDVTLAVQLALELREKKADDVEAAASAEFILGAAHETDLRWFEASPRYTRAAELAPNARRLDKACELALLVDNLPLARRFCEARITHVKNEMGSASIGMAEALADLAEIESQLGDVSAALEHFKTAITIGSAAVEDKDRLVHAETLARYAEFLTPLGRLKEAEGSAQRALEITETVLGPTHRDVASRLESLGRVYAGDFSAHEASRAFEKCLDITRVTPGPTHPDYARRLLEYADARFAAGDADWTEVQAMTEESLAIIRQSLGVEHFDYGRALRKYSILLWNSGDIGLALETAENALLVIRNSRGAASAQHVYALESLAAVASMSGNYQYAEQKLLVALDVARGSYGENSLIAGEILVALGSLYQAAARYADAETVLRDARAVHRVVMGEDSLKYAWTASALATALRELGRPHEALDLARSGHDTVRRILGDASALTAIDALALGTILVSLGELDEAEALMEDARRIIEKAWDHDTAIWAMATQALAQVHLQEGSHAEAERLYADALKVFEQTTPEVNAVFQTRFNLVLARAFQGKAEQAIQDAEDLKAFAAIRYEAAHLFNGLAHRAAAIAYQQASDYSAAESEYRAAVRILEQVEEGGAMHRAMSLVGLGQILSELRRTQDAAHVRMQAAELITQIYGPAHRWAVNLRVQAAQSLILIEKFEDAEQIISELLVQTSENFGRASDEHWTVVSYRAWLERSRGVSMESVGIHEERLALAIEKFGETSEERIVSLKLLSDVHKELGQLDPARAYLQEALELANRILPEGHDEIGDLIWQQKNLAAAAGDFRGAVDHAKRHVVFARTNTSERPADLVNSLNVLGDALGKIDEIEAARNAYEEAVDLSADLENDGAYKAGAALTDLGHLAQKLGDDRTAERHFDKAMDIILDLGGTEHEAYPYALGNLASAKLMMNDIEAARESYDELVAFVIDRHGENSEQFAKALLRRSSVSLRAGDLVGAEADIDRALDLLGQAGTSQDDLEDALADKADLLVAMERFDEAAAIWEDQAAVVEETDNDLRFNTYDARHELAWLRFERGAFGQAASLAAQQVSELESVGLTQGWNLISARTLEAILAVLDGDHDSAEEILDSLSALVEDRYSTETMQRALIDEARMYLRFARGDEETARIDRALLEDRARRLLGESNPDLKRLQSRIEFVLTSLPDGAVSTVAAE